MSVTSSLRRDVSDAITQQASERSVSPGLTHVLSPKFISARARPLGKTENRSGRLILFVLIGALFWVFVFGLLYRLLKYFRGIPEIGALLAATLLLVNIFPARRTRDILSVIAVLAAAGVVLIFRLVRPERLARPEGFRSLVEFISLLRGPTSPWLPSEWAAQGIMTWLRNDPEILPFYLLISTAAAAIVFGSLLHRWLYTRGFSKSQESGERWVRQGTLGKFVSRILTPWGVMRRELVLKVMRLFFRDTTQWSQLILLTVLVVVYVFNIKFLPLRGEGVTFFLANVIPFVNLILAGFVLASIAARFIFPGISLEGRTLWLLRSSPLEMRQLLWSKFWVGTLPLLALALVLVFATDVLLQVSGFTMAVSIFTITMMTFAIAGLALGFGALFPKFNTENAAQIPTSFGGLILMMASVVLIGLVIILEARRTLAEAGDGQRFGRDAVLLPKQAEQQMLGPDVAVAEFMGDADRLVERDTRALRIGQVRHARPGGRLSVR